MLREIRKKILRKYNCCVPPTVQWMKHSNISPHFKNNINPDMGKNLYRSNSKITIVNIVIQSITESWIACLFVPEMKIGLRFIMSKPALDGDFVPNEVFSKGGALSRSKYFLVTSVLIWSNGSCPREDTISAFFNLSQFFFNTGNLISFNIVYSKPRGGLEEQNEGVALALDQRHIEATPDLGKSDGTD